MNSFNKTKKLNSDIDPYSVGALLYTPAINSEIADYIINNKLDKPYSLAICLEDTISEYYVNIAESNLISILNKIYSAKKVKDFYIPNEMLLTIKRL